mmetsp:Transcript_11322/g.17047  ORF Transcript_11322/g.17047 Transcript_11322/m.17047 type:complete len:96 (+) Transcript_11322:1-288(+)
MTLLVLLAGPAGAGFVSTHLALLSNEGFRSRLPGFVSLTLTLALGRGAGFVVAQTGLCELFFQLLFATALDFFHLLTALDTHVAEYPGNIPLHGI